MCILIVQCTSNISESSTPEKKESIAISPKEYITEVDNYYWVDFINGQSAIIGQPLVLEEEGSENIIIEGWVVNPSLNNLVDQVFLKIGDKEFLCIYGKERIDVSKALGNSSLVNCGFSADISKGELEKGLNRIVLKIVTNNNVYISSNAILIEKT